MVNTEKLNEAILKAGYYKQYLASVLGISRQNLSNKINNRVSFSGREVKTLKRMLDLSDSQFVEIFFADECSSEEHEGEENGNT